MSENIKHYAKNKAEMIKNTILNKYLNKFKPFNSSKKAQIILLLYKDIVLKQYADDVNKYELFLKNLLLFSKKCYYLIVVCTCIEAYYKNNTAPTALVKPNASDIYTNLTSTTGVAGDIYTNLTSATHAACGSVEAGNLTSAAGNLTSAAGNLTSAAGNLTSAAGNLTSATHAACGSVEAGNLTSAAGAALHNITPDENNKTYCIDDIDKYIMLINNIYKWNNDENLNIVKLFKNKKKRVKTPIPNDLLYSVKCMPRGFQKVKHYITKYILETSYNSELIIDNERINVLTVNKQSITLLTIDEQSVTELTIDEQSVIELTVDEQSITELTIDEQSFTDLTIDDILGDLRLDFLTLDNIMSNDDALNNVMLDNIKIDGLTLNDLLLNI